MGFLELVVIFAVAGLIIIGLMITVNVVLKLIRGRLTFLEGEKEEEE